MLFWLCHKVAACTNLAQKYNDQSVLENHHISIAFDILSTDAFAILEKVDTPTYNYIRKILIETILATDMARHRDLSAQFSKVCIYFFATFKCVLAHQMVIVAKCSVVAHLLMRHALILVTLHM